MARIEEVSELLNSAAPPGRSRLQAVIFDMDGVIVDSHPAHRYAWKEFLHTIGKEVMENDLDFISDGRKRQEILQHFLGPLTDLQIEEYGRLKNDLFLRAAAQLTPIVGLFEFIECIRRAGVAMAVATSASASRTRSILSRLGLLTHFAAVVTGDEVAAGKPDPEIYLAACRRTHCHPTSAVAIEDAVAGIQAAKNAGLKCLGIASSAPQKKLISAGADCVLPNFINLTLEQFQSLVGFEKPPCGAESESLSGTPI